MKNYNSLIFELSKEGRKAYSLPPCDVPDISLDSVIPPSLMRDSEPELPEVSEVDVVRHFTNLSNKNYGVDTGFYPLGSCTMKYNPKINEDMANLGGFSNIHPLQPEATVQGALELMYELDGMLSEISGMDRVSLQPAAGAHGELTGLMIIKAYHESRGDKKRKKIIVPDSAHGTNPASAAVAGFEIVEIESDKNGAVDLDRLKAVLSDEIAGLMLTNPSTLGLFEKNIKQIADLVHESGGLLYYDGANTNAIMGIARPGDMGFDVIHLNLHKTFSTPHGGGGPGSGPVGVKSELARFLPVPVIEKKGDSYILDYDRPDSIGKVKSFYGNFGVAVKAYAYILSMGGEGLTDVSRKEVQRRPQAPFITSTLQQEASRKAGLAVRRTMQLAQELYEGVDLGPAGTQGLITYMRTDSTNIAASAQQAAREEIARRYGEEYLPERPPVYSRKAKGAQEAHEAIRPTSPHQDPASVKAFLTTQQFKL